MRQLELTGRLMNNTKWRELLSLTIEMGVQFDVAFTRDGKFHQAGFVSTSALGPTAVADPGLNGGGPHKYDEIFALRVRRYTKERNPLTGVIVMDEGRSIQYLHKIAALGALPAEVCGEYIYVRGYTTAEP